MRTLGYISRITSLNGKHQLPNVSSRYRVDKFVAKGRQDVRF